MVNTNYGPVREDGIKVIVILSVSVRVIWKRIGITESGLRKKKIIF